MIVPLSSLRTRLMLLMLIAAVPAFLVIGYSAHLAGEREIEHQKEALLVLARSLAGRHRENLDSARLLLASLAHMPEIRAGEGRACTEMLAGVHALAPPHIEELFVVRPGGDILCGAAAPGRRANVADMPWFRKALAAEGARVGEYHISRRSGEPTIVVTHTVRTKGGAPAVLGAAINLSWLSRQPLLSGGTPAGTAYALYDPDGTILLGHPDGSRIGRNIAGSAHWRTLSALGDASVFQGRDADGIEKVFAYAPLGLAEAPLARLAVELPTALATASSRDFLAFGLGGLAAAMVLGLILGGIGSRRLILKPLDPVLNTVHRVAEGDLSARTALEIRRDDEISRLASEVDRMAEALSQRDRALTDSRDRAQAYLDIVGVMVVALNEKGNVALANRKACDMLGCGPPGQCVGGNWFDNWIPLGDREKVKGVFERILAGDAEPVEYYENEVLSARGRRRLIAWHNTPLRDKSGRIIGTLSAGQDVTDQRRTENALRKSEERLRLAQEGAHVGIWDMDARTGELYWSPECEQIYGIPPGMVKRQEDWRMRVHPEDLPLIEAQGEAAIAHDAPFDVEFRIRHASGETRWIVSKGRGIRDAAGEIVRLTGINMDITERKRLQEERERLQAQLQQAQKMEALGQLTGGIAHDFNNILASVLGFSKLALRRHVPDQNSELAGHLKEVIAASERARDLIARMLAFSRARPDSRATTLAPLPLAKEAVSMLTTTIPPGIRIEMDFAADLPDIVIDPVDFHQIVMNLVINARDALGEHGRVEIGLARAHVGQATCTACHAVFSGDWLELRVADDGPGIAPEVLPRIFEPFFTTKEVGKGTGMGLAMVHGLVQRAGGHFLVETVAAAQGAGTVFRVFFPTADAP